MRRILLALIAMACSSTSSALLTPQQALTDALSEPLAFVGWYMPTYSESQKRPNCVFKNSKVFVMTHYCVRGNIPAGSIRIHSANLTDGYVQIYAELPDTGKDISEGSRAEYYSFLWNVSARLPQRAFDFNMSARQYQSFDQAEVRSFSHYCVTANSSNTQPYFTTCVDILDQRDVWGPQAYAFWQAPGPELNQLFATLKQQVRNLPPSFPY